ncbi:endonuclease domain-containing protein [Methylobacterium nodulans]|uniref:DUF559 domain-containing protein n=1 Tax=Methylobacterium nodulans (strain LMG 21967 / CNCM I-2342 / ORS 2060) TaxID=460265 RepID=B8IMU8_METNO|nr:DUF559 domain-containing protein [Methylobacterium nodulans]ACL60291.1 protein of unknown function DUF559 [Methylobacterium nodulans ORS 2060]
MIREPRRFARSLRQQATSAEDVLWRALRGRRLHGVKFRRQAPFLLYTVDFLCFERKLIVELDGRQHDWHDVYDARRTKEIERSGFALIRFRNDEVLSDLDAALNRISAALHPAGHPGPESSIPRPVSASGERSGETP